MKRLIAGLIFIVTTLSAFAVQAESIQSYTKEMKKIEGFFTVYHQEKTDQVFMEIPKKTTDFIFQTSLPRGIGSNDLGLDRGQLGKTRLATFTIQGNKVLLTQKNTKYRAQTDNQAEALSVQEAFAESVLYGFPVVAESSQAVLIDYTGFLKTDIHQIADRLSWQNEGHYKIDESRSVLWPERIKSFPKNTELEAKVTYTGNNAGPYVRSVAPEPKALTVHLHHSFIELPEPGFNTRAFHPMSGYFSMDFEDYAAPLQSDMKQRLIPRHRLQKKNPQAKRSEVVEPIVYYLDPGVPEPVRSALLDGARWWAEAFEEAGFINAYQVKMLPEDADPMDVRYNTIQWVHRATRGWSYGASVTDPRTGEILKGHVTLGSLRVRQDMLIAEGLLAAHEEGANEYRLKEIEKMALARIRQLSAHEVGHTLGLAHNFAASPQGRASVMDYPSPYITEEALKAGDLSDAYGVGLGAWDKYAIAYGYQEFNPSEEAEGLKRLREQAYQQGLHFIADADARPEGGGHASAHLWDNGKHVNQELIRLGQLRHQAIHNFGLQNLAEGKPISELGRIFVPVYLMHRYQTEAVVKQIGGAHYQYYVKGEGDFDYQVVPPATQKEALKLMLYTLEESFLAVPNRLAELLVPKSMGYGTNREDFKTRQGLFPDPIGMAETSAYQTLSLLLNPERLNRLATQAHYDKKQLSVQTVVNLLIEKNQQQLQHEESLIAQRVAYLTAYQLTQSLFDAKTTPEVKSVVMNALQKWQVQLEKQSKKRSARNSHYMQYLAQLIAQSIQDRAWPEDFKPLEMPPGAPI